MIDASNEVDSFEHTAHSVFGVMSVVVATNVSRVEKGEIRLHRVGADR